MKVLRAVLRHVGALAVATFFMLPIYYLVVGSLRRPGTAPPPVPEVWPATVSLESYQLLFEILPLGEHVLNSLAIVALLVPGSTLVAALAGFALAQLGPRAARPILGLTIVALFVPLSGLLVGRFAVFSLLGVTDSFLPLWALAAIGGSPFFVLIYYWSFSQQPREIGEAARLDGAGPWQTWRHVAMPTAAGTTAVVAALAFVLAWGAFLEPLAYLADEALFPATLAIAALRTIDVQNVPILLAGAVVIALPPVVAFALAQRRIELLAFQENAEESR